MNILFIRNSDRFSGSETYDINLFSELIKYPSIKIYFLTNLRSLARRVSQQGIATKVISWGAEGIGTKRQLLSAVIKLPRSLSRYILLIHKLEKNKRFNYICLQSMTEKVFLTPLLKILGYKIIWTELGPIYATKMSQIIKRLYKIASLFVDKIVTISQDTKHDLTMGGVNIKKIVAIYIGVDINKFELLNQIDTNLIKKRLHIQSKSFVIGFLGTITDEKGIEDFVDVSDILIKQNKNFHFIVIGNGPFLPWVKRSIKRLKISSNYTCTGFVEDVEKNLGVIDILLLPTRHYEGLPLAILEAQSMGKVVITSNMGGIPEIIKNGINGFFYDEFNKEIVVKLIKKLYARKTNLIKLKMEARKNIISRFNIQTQSKLFLKVLQSL